MKFNSSGLVQIKGGSSFCSVTHNSLKGFKEWNLKYCQIVLEWKDLSKGSKNTCKTKETRAKGGRHHNFMWFKYSSN